MTGPVAHETNIVYRCVARALDLGHCQPGDCPCRPLTKESDDD